MSDEAPQGITPIPPTQRLQNLEYLAFRLFINQTDLPELPEPEPRKSSIIHTVEDVMQQAEKPTPPPVRVPYDLAYARGGVEQIIQATAGSVSVPHMIHAAVASIKQFNAQAEAADAQEAAGN